jgi:hypothetical protein
MLLSQSLSIRPSLNSPFASRRRVLLSAEGKLSFILMMLLRIMTKMYFFASASASLSSSLFHDLLQFEFSHADAFHSQTMMSSDF